MSAAQRMRMRNNLADVESHFEQSLQELNAIKRGSAGRSAHVHDFVVEDENSDALRETFILRKTSLDQEQWDNFLSPDAKASNMDDSAREGSALLGRKSGLSQGSATGDGAVTSRKSSSFDVETGANTTNNSNRSNRSIFFLPLTTPWNTFIMIWTQVILLLDLTYTAFMLPILVGFEVSDVDWGYGCIIDFVAGLFYAAEFLINFHVGFIGKNNTRRRLIMDGRAIAWFYIMKGHFFVDFLTVLVWIAQIIFIALYQSGNKSLDNGVATKVYQAVRVLRLIRFTSLLRRLYATAAVAQSTIMPGLHVSNALAQLFNICFGGLVLINFLNCLWNFTAIAENFNSTWINLYSVFIRMYGSADSQTNGMLTPEEAAAIPGTHRYLVGMYYVLVTVGTVGYGDIFPQTVAEEIVSMFIIVLGLVFFGIILASLAEALQRLSLDISKGEK